jgi:NAD(P)-dependent dehydrogenase (short-subunit alcohol dehydrogenase family)
MALIHQRVVIFDSGTEAGEATARLAAAQGANVTLVRHVAGPAEQPPGSGLYETVGLDLSRPPAVEAWLAALEGPIDHLLIGHSAGEGPGAGPDGTWQWAYGLVRRGKPPVGQSVALFSGPRLVPADGGGEPVPGEVEDAYVRWLAKALQPLRVNAVWTQPVRSPLAADSPVQARQALYLSAAPLTRSRVEMAEDVARALVWLMNGTALSGSVLRLTNALPAPDLL